MNRYRPHKVEDEPESSWYVWIIFLDMGDSEFVQL